MKDCFLMIFKIKLKNIIFTFALISISNLTFAQGLSTMIFLRIEPSPMLNGMGRVGTALPVDEALAFYYNPAQLCVGNNNFEYQFYPEKVNWLPGFSFDDITLNNIAFKMGYSFYKNSIPFKIGVGYIHNEFDYGDIIITDSYGRTIGIVTSKESYNSFGIGLGVNYYLDISFGFAYKYINSELPSLLNLEDNIDAHVHAFDYGILITYPFTKAFDHKFDYQYSENIKFSPSLDFSLGYAKRNIGGKVYYKDIDRKYPLPRTANLGYSVSGGINMAAGETTFKAFSIDYSIDAGDELVNSNRDYQGGFLGDINIFDNIISAKSEEKIIIHKGFRYSIFDFLYITSGKFGGDHMQKCTTSGFGFSSEGVLKFLDKYYNITYVDYLSKHMEIKYFYSTIDSEEEFHPLKGTKYSSISIVVKGF